MRSATIVIVALFSIARVMSGQTADSSTAYTRVMDLQFGGSIESTVRIVALGGSGVGRITGSMTAIDARARTPEGLGAWVRYQTGSLPADGSAAESKQLQTFDGALLIGGYEFAVVPGYQSRWFSVNQSYRQLNIGRIGAEVGHRAEAVGAAIRVAGSYLHTFAPDKRDSLEAQGFDGETHFTYAPPRLPLYVDLGYERETLSFSNPAGVIRREEFSKVILGIGVQYGLSLR